MNESDPQQSQQPAPPTQPGGSAVPPPAPGPESGTTGLPPNVAAGLAGLFPLIGGIIIFVLEKKDAFVRFYAMQSIYFGAACFIISIILSVISAVPFIGWIIGPILFLIYMVGGFILWLMNVIKAFSGVRWEMPFLGAMAKKQLEKTDGTPTV